MSGEVATLAEAAAFTRPVEAAGGTADYMVYANIQRIVEALMAEGEEDEFASLLEPLQAILLSATAGEDVSTYGAVLTID